MVKKIQRLKSNTTRYECICDCGTTTQTTRTSLISGQSKSCGCLAKESTLLRFKKHNTYHDDRNVSIGVTFNTKRKFVVDISDKDSVSAHCWYEMKSGYISSRINGVAVYLHRFLLGDSSMKIDHINGDRTDNRRENLRFVTDAQNVMNRGIQSNNKSGVTGVYYDKFRCRWIASLTHNGKKFFKRFECHSDAIKYRLELEQTYFKEYAPTRNGKEWGERSQNGCSENYGSTVSR